MVYKKLTDAQLRQRGKVRSEFTGRPVFIHSKRYKKQKLQYLNGLEQWIQQRKRKTDEILQFKKEMEMDETQDVNIKVFLFGRVSDGAELLINKHIEENHNLIKLKKRERKQIHDEIYNAKYEEFKEICKMKTRKIYKHNDIEYYPLYIGFNDVSVSPLFIDKYILYEMEEFKICSEQLSANDDLAYLFNSDRISSTIVRLILLSNKIKKENKKLNGEKRTKKLKDNAEALDELLDNPLNDGELKIMSKFTEYKFNKEAKTFGDMLKIEWSDYVQDNYHANSCFLNLIVNAYNEPTRKNQKQQAFTYQKVCDILGIEHMNQDLSVTIKQSIKFFEKYKLGLDVLSSFGHLMFRYRPETLSKVIRPQVLQMIVAHNHAYKVNLNTKKIKFMDEIDYDELSCLKISDRYPLMNPIDNDDIPVISYTESLDSITKITTNNPEKNIDFKMTQCDSLDQFVYDMVTKENIIPVVSAERDKISCVKWRIGKQNYTMERPVTKSTENEPIDMFIPENEYLTYTKKHYMINNEFLNPEYLSEYPKCVRDFEKNYCLTANTGYFTQISKGTKLSGIDLSKAYTSLYTKISKIPVFKHFDVYEPYNNEQLNPFYMYLVESTIDEQSHVMLFNQKYTRRYGFFLMEVQKYGIPFKVHYVRKYSKLVNCNFNKVIRKLYQVKTRNKIQMQAKRTDINTTELQDYIEILNHIYQTDSHKVMKQLYDTAIEYEKTAQLSPESMTYVTEANKLIAKLYNNHIDEELKKKIVNMASGMHEKRNNRKTISKLFKSYAEAEINAFLLANKDIKSHIFPILGESTIPDETHKKLYPNAEQKMKDDYIFLLNIFQERELCESFIQIKEMIYCMMNLRMYNLYVEAESKGLQPVAIRTDSILCLDDVSTLAKSNFDNVKNRQNQPFDNIGKLKFETNKVSADIHLQQIDNTLLPHNIPAVNTLKLKDEWKSDEYKQIFENYNRVIVKGVYPGSGKTYSVINYCMENNKKLLMIVPQNELAIDLKRKSDEYIKNGKEGFEIMTCHVLLQLNPFQKVCHMKKIDISEYDVICFDEFYSNNYSIKRLIDAYITNNPTKKFIACGDILQNDPIGDNEDVDTEEERNIDHEKIVNMMFPTQIQLEIDKRHKTEEDRQKMYKFKKDIFDLTKPVFETVKKYFNVFTDIAELKTDMNITYSNRRSDEINTLTHNKQETHKKKYKIKNVNYWVGLKVICRKSLHKYNIVLYTNNIYRITKIDTANQLITVEDSYYKDEHTITNSVFLQHFKLPYCRTGHSVQGKTYDNDITIFELDSPYVSRKWAYTALTRTREFNQISCFQATDEQNKQLRYAKRVQYFQLKVDNYKRQDRKADRKIDEKKYIDADWFIDQILKNQMKCHYCKCQMEITPPINGCIVSTITANRINNKKAHHKDNCAICCVECNRKMSDKLSFVL